MRPPEMSYSPAYRQAQGPLGSIPPVLARPPRRPQQYTRSTHTGPSHPSELMGRDGSPRTSGPRGSHTHSREAPRRASPTDGDAIVIPIVVTNGSTHKEERSRGSWADRPSLMSAEHSASPRTPNRAAPSNAGPDALLMLVCAHFLPSRMILLADIFS